MLDALNRQIAAKLNEAAEILEQQRANPFRVSAYRRAADTVAKLDRDLGEILEKEGYEGLLALPNIGKGIATAIYELIATGRWMQLERLRGSLDPVQLFQTLPGIGPELARRIHEMLHVDTLEALETAAYDGRLEAVKGLGKRRLAALRATLASILGRARRRSRPGQIEGPPVAVLLEVDEEYRQRAESGELPRIAPKRFNPEGKAWLPILHTECAGWHFTAMYSNTARAHELHRIQDWVVVYFYDNHHEEGQHTIVTETRGPLIGKRVIRGRELECRDYYLGLALNNSLAKVPPRLEGEG